MYTYIYIFDHHFFSLKSSFYLNSPSLYTEKSVDNKYVWGENVGNDQNNE